jgi:hypothetical protein
VIAADSNSLHTVCALFLNIVSWCHRVGVNLQKGAVALRYHGENGKIQVVHVRHLRCLRFPSPAFLSIVIGYKVVKSCIDVWTSVVALVDRKMTFVFTSTSAQSSDFRKDLMAEEGHERELRFVGCSFIGSDHVAIHKVGVVFS